MRPEEFAATIPLERFSPLGLLVRPLVSDDGHDGISDAQLRAFAALTDEQKIAWLEEWQQVTWALATPAVRRSWWRLRGKEIPDHPDFRDAPDQNDAASR